MTLDYPTPINTKINKNENDNKCFKMPQLKLFFLIPHLPWSPATPQRKKNTLNPQFI